MMPVHSLCAGKMVQLAARSIYSRFALKARGIAHSAIQPSSTTPPSPSVADEFNREMEDVFGTAVAQDMSNSPSSNTVGAVGNPALLAQQLELQRGKLESITIAAAAPPSTPVQKAHADQQNVQYHFHFHVTSDKTDACAHAAMEFAKAFTKGVHVHVHSHAHQEQTTSGEGQSHPHKNTTSR